MVITAANIKHVESSLIKQICSINIECKIDKSVGSEWSVKVGDVSESQSLVISY